MKNNYSHKSYINFWTVAISVLIVIMIQSCGVVKDCDYVAKEFYECLKTKQFEKVISLIDDEALKVTSQDLWIEGLKQKDAEFGILLNAARYDFETETQDRVTRVTIKYKVNYSNAVMFERLEFLQRDKTFKITYYQYNSDSTAIN